MALNLKNSEVERLAAEVAKLAGTSKTEAIRRALQTEKDRLTRPDSENDNPAAREARLLEFLKTRVWPTIPENAKRRWTREEEDEALGYGEFGEPV